MEINSRRIVNADEFDSTDGFEAWMRRRPPAIQHAARKYPPTHPYRLPNGDSVMILSYTEGDDGEFVGCSIINLDDVPDDEEEWTIKGLCSMARHLCADHMDKLEPIDPW